MLSNEIQSAIAPMELRRQRTRDKARREASIDLRKGAGVITASLARDLAREQPDKSDYWREYASYMVEKGNR